MMLIPEPMSDGWNPNMDQDYPIRAQVCDLTGILDPDIFLLAMEENLRNSRFAMATGSTIEGNPQD